MKNILKAKCHKYVQIHMLINRFMANRNEDGTLKSIVFGGVDRDRASSQSQKHPWRYHEDAKLGLRTILDGDKPVALTHPSRDHFNRVLDKLVDLKQDARTKSMVTRAVYDIIVGKKGAGSKADEAVAKIVSQLTKVQEDVKEFEAELSAATSAKDKTALTRKLTSSQKKEQDLKVKLHNAGGKVEGGLDSEETEIADQDAGKFNTQQVMILSDHEIDVLTKLVREAVIGLKDDEKPHDVASRVVSAWKKSNGDTFRSLRVGCGIQAALFGRPAYGSVFDDVIAAVGVSHLIGVHARRMTFDTFSAMDEFKKDAGEMGAGMLGDVPLSHALLYGYVVINTHVLIENIERKIGDSELAAEAVRRLILLISRTAPTTKHGSLASTGGTRLLLVEVGDDQPENLMNAFLEPVTRDDEHPDMCSNALNRLAKYMTIRDRSQPTTNVRAMMTTDLSDTGALPLVVPTMLSDYGLADWTIAVANGDPLPKAEHKANGTHPKPVAPAGA